MRCDVCILFIRSSLILFECPAKIPRSSLRSFSLWARHSAETSAELNVRLGAAEFLPVASRQVRRVRKRRRKEMRGRRSERLGSRVGTRYKPAIRRLRRTAVRWGPQFSSSAPPRSPAPPFDHFPFGHARVFISAWVTRVSTLRFIRIIRSPRCLTIQRNVKTGRSRQWNE